MINNNYIKKVFVILLIFLIHSCKSKDCNRIPNSFSSFEEAINVIKNSNFKLRDSIIINEGSYIRSVKFYSCDLKFGYFFYSREFHFDYFCNDVPIRVWNEFKKNDNKSDFIKNKIYGKYTGIHIVVDLDKINKD